MKKYFLLYIDILGFEKLPKEIAERTGIEKDSIRENYLSKPLREKIEEIKERERIKAYPGRDDYLLFVEDTWKTLQIINEISHISVPIKDYPFIPLEIAVGIKEFNEIIPIKDDRNRNERKESKS